MTMHNDKAIGMWCFKENSVWMQDHENKLVNRLPRELVGWLLREMKFRIQL